MVCLCWFCDAGFVGVSVCVDVFVCIRGRWRWWGRKDVWVGFVDGEEREEKEVKCEINKILVCKATVTVHIL